MKTDRRRTVQETVELIMGLEHADPAARLIEDLGAESADVVNIIAALEDRFEISVPEEEIPELHTVADLQDMVEQRGDR
ncbi:MAG: phosphopantetheine-binding protein [Anaerolineales bacterium]